MRPTQVHLCVELRNQISVVLSRNWICTPLKMTRFEELGLPKHAIGEFTYISEQGKAHEYGMELDINH